MTNPRRGNLSAWHSVWLLQQFAIKGRHAALDLSAKAPLDQCYRCAPTGAPGMQQKFSLVLHDLWYSCGP